MCDGVTVEDPVWLPELVYYNDYGDWRRYIDALYEMYLDDFIRDPILIEGKRVFTRREPRLSGKDKAFWHICGDDDSQNRRADFARHERIRWPRAIILHRDDTTIKMWSDDCFKGSNGKLQVSIWFNDEYLVILEPRAGYVLFITAYCTDRGHKIRALQKRFNQRQNCPVSFDVPEKTETATGGNP